MKPPGGLTELGKEGRGAWSATVAGALDHALTELGRDGLQPTHLTGDLALAADVRSIDWPAFPARIEACLGTDRALELFDWRPPDEGDVGRISHQEEYLEWRLIRRGDEVRGIEMTTEFPEYWQVLAAHEPQRTLELVAEFAGEDEEDVDHRLVYGGEDPPAPGDDPDSLEKRFLATMLPRHRKGVDPRTTLAGVSPYNDGRRALCCMIQRNNTLGALVALVASAARPYLVRDPDSREPRFASGSEAIEGLKASAQDGRNSDPLLVERVARFATEGRQVAVDDPIGVYIRELQRHELAQPDGEDVPRDWIDLSRGLGASEAADGRPRRQRLRFALPDDADFALNELVVRRTGEPLRFGGQLAALVELVAYLRTGPAVDPVDGPVHASAVGARNCDTEDESWAEFEASKVPA